MNMNKKLLALAMGIGLAASGSVYAGTEVSSSPSDAIDPISSLTMTDGTFTFNQGSSSTGVGATMTATDVMTILIANNNAPGYDIDVVATHGVLLVNTESSPTGIREGLIIDYKLACDSYVDEEGTTISAFSAANLSLGVSTEIYSHATPNEATVNQSPSCDLTLADGEELKEKLAATYTDTFTFTIVND